ncbi:CIR protein PIR protein [Plasmodium vinckei lentum]|uniref:CIR protein PIR protein n=1 Tax=Plasmodium vinckei lentum TaxID=138297 RepID=A0A6V7S0U3_PLAVN|nr:CIR protein PIR protein [Plasmodium vinckei lentum]
MAKSCFNFNDVNSEFNKINGYFSETMSYGLTIERTKGEINKYCHYGNTQGYGKCHDYFQRASSGVIYLLTNLKDKFDSKYDKLAEYAILWLSYKLNIKPKNKLTDLNQFYNHYIVKNNDYNKKIKDNDSTTYKEVIDKKKDLMNMNINEILKFYEALKTLCNMYSECNKGAFDCNNCSQKAKKFVQNFEKLNKDSKNLENTSYSQMLSRLSDDYNNLKNKYGNDKCTDFPSIPQLNLPKSSTQNPVVNSGKVSGQALGQTSKVTSSSSSILNTVIPGLSIVSVIPVFLGIAYKYSLFGVDKLFQRQYLRKKLKKVKKKLKLNI